MADDDRHLDVPEIRCRLLSLNFCSKLDPSTSDFDSIVSFFLKATVGRRPFPALLYDCQPVDLFRLFSVVREHGGHVSVTSKWSWDSVSEAIGLDRVRGAELKSIHLKYLACMDDWLHVVQRWRTRAERDAEVRESLAAMVRWVKEVAADPTAARVSSSFGESEQGEDSHEHRDMLFSYTLLVREAMSIKKKRKFKHSYKVDKTERTSRSRQRIKLMNRDAEQHPTLPSSNSDLFCRPPDYKGPKIGSNHQVQVPDFAGTYGETSGDIDDQSKWLGTRIWRSKDKAGSPAMQDSVGRGRKESCSCENPGSLLCVRFHVAESRQKLAEALGLAFSEWRFDDMGEEVAQSWTHEEQTKFEAAVNSSKSKMNFWIKLRSVFPSKAMKNLVSYYYNVFLLRRRSRQNREVKSAIDSDEDDPGVGDFRGERKPRARRVAARRRNLQRGNVDT